MPATLSILGLYRWDNTIFDKMILPTRLSESENGKELVVTEILSQCAELEILYTDPIIVKSLIGNWSLVNKQIFQKLEDTLFLEYDPIYNYDRTEHEEFTQNKQERGGGSGQQSNTQKGQSETNEEFTEQKSAYNSQNLVTSAKTTTGIAMDSNSSMDTDSTSQYSANTTDQWSREHRQYGNIGVTTTQQMIEAEREIVQFDLVQHIVNSFKTRFCILVY